MIATANELAGLLNLPESYSNQVLESLSKADSRYIRDLKVNFKNTLTSEKLTEKETALIGLSIAVNENNSVLTTYFVDLATSKEASESEVADTVACASLLASNNVLYRFRHYTGQEIYDQLPAKIKMNIMMNPSTGKELFELISLAVSAANGCERCVNAHEHSLKEMGTSEERIFDAIRLTSVLVSLSKVIF